MSPSLYLLIYAWAASAILTTATHSRQQHPLNSDYNGPIKSNTSFPGESPFHYCEESDPQNDLFNIEWIAVTPTPPSIGDIFNLRAYGSFNEPFTANATVNVTGWYETNPLAPFSATQSFCQMVDEVDMDDFGRQCPPQRGNGTITAVKAVPWGLPEGNYSAKVDALTEDDRRIFCIEGWVWMKNEGGGWYGGEL